MTYHLCPECFRATPAQAKERYCPNDGTRLLEACPQCHASISSPHAQFCSQCGYHFAAPLPRPNSEPHKALYPPVKETKDENSLV
jgi:hypothetical protein